MTSLFALSANSVAPRREEWIGAVALAGLAHALLGGLLPALFLGDLHADTLEAIAWSRELDWGYAKHPPLLAWLLHVAMSIPGPRIFVLMILSQASVALTAALVYATTRLFASGRVAACAVLIYLASMPSFYFAVKLNHNSLLIPFAAGILFFGLRYLERCRTLDALALGIVAGFGLLTKYQAAFFLMTLLAASLVVPRFRWVWSDPRSYVAALIALTVFAPHLWWDAHHGWGTLLYAASDRPLRTLFDLGVSLNELLDGLLMCAVGPLFAWLLVGRPKLAVRQDERSRLGFLLGTAPLVATVALSFATGQVLRQGWLIPLAPTLAVGLALLVAEQLDATALTPRALTRRSIAFSAAQVAAVAAFLLGRAALGDASDAYSLDAETLGHEAAALWRTQGSGPIPCLLTPNRSTALASLLVLQPTPKVVDLDASRPMADLRAACPAGGLAIVPEGHPTQARLAASGWRETDIAVPTRPRVGPTVWVFRAFVIPPP